MERVRLANGKDLVIFSKEDLKQVFINNGYSLRYNLKAPKGEFIEDIFNKSFIILYVDEAGTTILKDRTKKINYETI